MIEINHPESPDDADSPDPTNEPLGLEPMDVDEAASLAEDPGQCPNCGAAMRGDSDVLCLRCGFDFKSGSPHATSIGAEAEVIASAVENGDAVSPALAVASKLDRAVLPIVAGTAVLALALAGLIGVRALFPSVEGDVAGAARLAFVVRLIVSVLFWAAAGSAGVIIGAWIFNRRVGDLTAIATRSIAIAAVAHLAVFLSVINQTAEFVLELAIQTAVFAVLTMVLFRLRPRDAITVLAIQVSVFVSVYGLAHLIAWAA